MRLLQIVKLFFFAACFSNMAQMAYAKTWFSSSENEVKNAFCRIQRPSSFEEINQFYAKLPRAGDVFSRHTVNGVLFINERSHLVYAFKKLVTSVNQADKNKIAPNDFKQKFKFGNCSKVLCASEIIFGKNIGAKMIYLIDQFQLNTSSYAYSNSTNFNSGELSDLIESLEFLPEHINIFKENQKLSRYPRGQIKAGKDSRLLANASMEYFDSWTNLSSGMRQYVAFHEYAHILANAHLNSFDASLVWRQMGYWVTNENQFSKEFLNSQNDHHSVSSYATTNPWEDFAESVSAYRFNPTLLKATSIEKYNYIKFLVFDGQEFDNEKNCDGTLNISRYQKMIEANTYPFTKNEKNKITQNCLAQFYRASFSNQSSAMFDQCINYEASTIWYKKVQQYNAVAPHSIFDPHTGFSSLRFAKLIKEATDYHIVGASTWLSSLIMKNGQFITYHNSTKENICQQLSFLSKYPFTRYRDSLWEQVTSKYNANFNTPTKSGIRLLCHNIFTTKDPQDLLPDLKNQKPSYLNFEKRERKMIGVFFDRKKLTEAIKKVITSKFE